jgi:hypothetical protein
MGVADRIWAGVILSGATGVFSGVAGALQPAKISHASIAISRWAPNRSSVKWGI